MRRRDWLRCIGEAPYSPQSRVSEVYRTSPPHRGIRWFVSTCGTRSAEGIAQRSLVDWFGTSCCSFPATQHSVLAIHPHILGLHCDRRIAPVHFLALVRIAARSLNAPTPGASLQYHATSTPGSSRGLERFAWLTPTPAPLQRQWCPGPPLRQHRHRTAPLNSPCTAFWT